MLGIALGISILFALFGRGLVPELEFDSIPLFNSNALYTFAVSGIVLFPLAVALRCSAAHRTDLEKEIARGITFGGGIVAVAVLSLLALVTLYAWDGAAPAPDLGGCVSSPVWFSLSSSPCSHGQHAAALVGS